MGNMDQYVSRYSPCHQLQLSSIDRAPQSECMDYNSGIGSGISMNGNTRSGRPGSRSLG